MSSKNNLELKHYCSNFKAIRSVLTKIGAKKEAIKKQEDFFFNVPTDKSKSSPRLKLRIENNEQFLVYYERPNFSHKKIAASKIKLYKVEDRHLLPFLKEALGVKAMVVKTREVWRKENTVFHLDTVKGVGTIFEVELQKTGKVSEKDRRIFNSYQEKLLPFLGEGIKGSNVDLVGKKKK